MYLRTNNDASITKLLIEEYFASKRNRIAIDEQSISPISAKMAAKGTHLRSVSELGLFADLLR